jgi:hypothetical protein
MILHVLEVKHVGAYRLHVRFSNGEAGEVDLAGVLDGEVFEPLQDAEAFASAHCHPVFKTVAWDNGADLAPEYLLEMLRSQRKQVA